ncbi:glutamine--fructose-6-phosphate transaminase (isomerizing) [candidate division KSB1 bacterium]
MCGIIGYTGFRNAPDVIIDGLKRMEYRGYDSAGVSLLQKDSFQIIKSAGKVKNLEQKLENMNLKSNAGIGHTRWATHGAPNEVNAHPHTDCTGKFTVIHNGIVENYKSLKQFLLDRGHKFKSETDTEIIAHLIEENYEGDLTEAVRISVNMIEGTMGLVIQSSNEPEKLIAVRNGSPIIIGLGKSENFIASDLAALVKYTKDVIYLEEGEISTITKDKVDTISFQNEQLNKKMEKVFVDLQQIEKGGFDHFMLKEIYEQPETVLNAFRGRIKKDECIVKLGGIERNLDEIIQAKRVIITACGTSWHAGLVAEYIFENLARIPVEVEYASEFRYRDPVINKGDLVIAVSQSGETADTLAAVKEAKEKGALVIGIVNVVGSMISRSVDSGIYIHAGPEIGVASTKAFTSQLTAFILLAILIGNRKKQLEKAKTRDITSELLLIPDKIKQCLEQIEIIKGISKRYYNSSNFLYLGRGYNFPVALEGALKLKEISYIHAEGYPAAEMKHGPIALIDEHMPVVVIALKDSAYPKIISNIEEIKARKGKVICIATEGDKNISALADDVIYIPETAECLTPLLSVIPLQLLAYHIAVLRGTSVDQPKNLAKSVTVE